MTEQDQIQKVIELYSDSMENSDPDKVKIAFHANAKVVGYLHGDFMELSTEEFAGFVAAQKPSPKEKNENITFDILSCDIEGTIASVKIRDQYLGITFLDILSLIKQEGEWMIYNKLFYVESE